MSYRPVVTDYTGFARHAAPQAIKHALRKADRAIREAQREQAWLTDLLARRQSEVDAKQPWCMGDHHSCVHSGPVPKYADGPLVFQAAEGDE